MTHTNKRRQSRSAARQKVRVTCWGSPGGAFPAQLANFSAEGVGLILGRELPPGCIVEVEWGSTLLLGELSYCRPEGKKFLAGVAVHRRNSTHQSWPPR